MAAKKRKRKSTKGKNEKITTIKLNTLNFFPFQSFVLNELDTLIGYGGSKNSLKKNIHTRKCTNAHTQYERIAQMTTVNN